MILIDENYEGIEDLTDNNSLQMFWVYDVVDDGHKKNNDFFMKTAKQWQSVISDAYLLTIGENSVWVPYNYYILIADYDSGLDCIAPDEIVGREFQALTMSNTLDESTSSVVNMKITGYEKDKVFSVPQIKAIYPVLISIDKVILISPKDFYNKIKNITIGSLL